MSVSPPLAMPGDSMSIDGTPAREPARKARSGRESLVWHRVGRQRDPFRRGRPSHRALEAGVRAAECDDVLLRHGQVVGKRHRPEQALLLGRVRHEQHRAARTTTFRGQRPRDLQEHGRTHGVVERPVVDAIALVDGLRRAHVIECAVSTTYSSRSARSLPTISPSKAGVSVLGASRSRRSPSPTPAGRTPWGGRRACRAPRESGRACEPVPGNSRVATSYPGTRRPNCPPTLVYGSPLLVT